MAQQDISELDSVREELKDAIVLNHAQQAKQDEHVDDSKECIDSLDEQEGKTWQQIKEDAEVVDAKDLVIESQAARISALAYENSRLRAQLAVFETAEDYQRNDEPKQTGKTTPERPLGMQMDGADDHQADNSSEAKDPQNENVATKMQNENKQSDTQPDDELSTVRAQNAVLQEQIVELNKRLAQADAEHAEELSFLKQEHAARGQKNQDLNLRYQQTVSENTRLTKQVKVLTKTVAQKDEKLKRIGNTITLAKRVAELETEVYVLRKELEFALLSENDGESDCECEDCDSEMTDIDESASEASFVLEKGEAEQSNYSTSLFRSKGSLSPASIVFVG